MMAVEVNKLTRRDVCWLCCGKLIWQSDFNYDEIFGEGEGIVAMLKCSGCDADVQVSQRHDEVKE